MALLGYGGCSYYSSGAEKCNSHKEAQPTDRNIIHNIPSLFKIYVSHIFKRVCYYLRMHIGGRTRPKFTKNTLLLMVYPFYRKQKQIGARLLKFIECVEKRGAKAYS
jgi:hypothetical protein